MVLRKRWYISPAARPLPRSGHHAVVLPARWFRRVPLPSPVARPRSLRLPPSLSPFRRDGLVGRLDRAAAPRLAAVDVRGRGGGGGRRPGGVDAAL
jgi:hypothetical protein